MKHQVVWFLLLGLGLLGTVTLADALTCRCDHCNNSSCEAGTSCYSQVLWEEGKELWFWGCFNSDYDYLCNTSSISLFETLCCESGDYCNNLLKPRIGEIGTPPPSTVAPVTDQATPVATPPTATEGPPTKFTPADARLCRKGSSNSPEYNICRMETTCFSWIRKRSDGRVDYRQGCSSQPCIPEQRNRKIKVCCNTSLCNSDLPVFPNDVQPILNPYPTVSTPDGDPKQSEETTESPPNVTTPSPPTDSPTSEDPPTTSTDALTNTPDDTADISCYCNECEETGLVCVSRIGCVSLYLYNKTSDLLQTFRTCLNSSSACSYSAPNLYVVCCNTDMCNEPINSGSVTSDLTTVPPVTRPITIPPNVDPGSEVSQTEQPKTPTSTILDAVPTIATPTTSSLSHLATPTPTPTPPQEADAPPPVVKDQQAESSGEVSLWYVGTGLVAALCVAIIVAMAIICGLFLRCRLRLHHKPSQMPITLNKGSSCRTSANSNVSLTSGENSQPMPV